jgi:hypothetical protein
MRLRDWIVLAIRRERAMPLLLAAGGACIWAFAAITPSGMLGR